MKRIVSAVVISIFVIGIGSAVAVEQHFDNTPTQIFDKTSKEATNSTSTISVRQPTQQAFSTSSNTSPHTVNTTNEGQAISLQGPAEETMPAVIQPSTSPPVTPQPNASATPPAPSPAPVVPCRLVAGSSGTARTCVSCPPPCGVSSSGHVCPMTAGGASIDSMCVPACGYAPTNPAIACRD